MNILTIVILLLILAVGAVYAFYEGNRCAKSYNPIAYAGTNYNGEFVCGIPINTWISLTDLGISPQSFRMPHNHTLKVLVGDTVSKFPSGNVPDFSIHSQIANANKGYSSTMIMITTF
jgi:hypothetical protein